MDRERERKIEMTHDNGKVTHMTARDLREWYGKLDDVSAKMADIAGVQVMFGQAEGVTDNMPLPRLRAKIKDLTEDMMLRMSEGAESKAGQGDESKGLPYRLADRRPDRGPMVHTEGGEVDSPCTQGIIVYTGVESKSEDSRVQCLLCGARGVLGEKVGV